jgi:hypothetical protein
MKIYNNIPCLSVGTIPGTKYITDKREGSKKEERMMIMRSISFVIITIVSEPFDANNIRNLQFPTKHHIFVATYSVVLQSSHNLCIRGDTNIKFISNITWSKV